MASLLGVLRHELRLLDRDQSRRDAHFRNPATGERPLEAARHAMRGSHHRVRADDRGHVPDHSPRAPLVVLLVDPLSERTTDLAELPLTARLGLLRHHHVSHRQPAVPLAAGDPRFRARA